MTLTETLNELQQERETLADQYMLAIANGLGEDTLPENIASIDDRLAELDPWGKRFGEVQGW